MQVQAMMDLDAPLHDSDSIIPPQTKPPHSFVPFSKSPSVVSSPPLSSTQDATSAGATGSGGSGSGFLSGTASGGRSSLGSASDHLSLPIMPFKDWELNLDALQVRPSVQHYLKEPPLPRARPRSCINYRSPKACTSVTADQSIARPVLSSGVSSGSVGRG
jgi:hypothetical protein